ncbi:hypothetical protein Nepgr_012573 [Nepenthes gracilis]|uniref:Uncharacterized protein n=1 Tax=Nepenthes gracilis TaxID=150966 RepID=A0AAD3SGC8_NEPGR|nr:hypothetical protein Nepgr_012573 [Nepenthes gracilis]
MIHILREKNEKADQLAKAVASGDPEQYAREMHEVLNKTNVEDSEIEDDSKGANARDSFQPVLLSRSSHPSGSQVAKPSCEKF